MCLLQVPKSSEDVNLKNPNDMSYVFSGAYAPMLCKLVEQVGMIMSEHGENGASVLM